MHFLNLVLFSIILYNERTFGLPQNWASLTGAKEGFDWQKEAKKSSGRGLSGDEDSEMMSSTVLEQHQDYNVVRYPASKWVCTKSVIDVSDDPLKDWEVVFNNDPMAAMAAQKKMNRPTSTMFKKLFRYIIGVNSDQAEIKMTRPVTTIRQKIKGKPGMETAVMCFWTGTPWADRKLPQPNDKSVFIQNRPELDVFVRRFGGWAMSEKKWTEEKQGLMRSLGSRMKDVNMEYYAHVGYNSPWTQENRRNEVWLVKRKGTAKFDNTKSKPVAGNDAGYTKESTKYETVPYDVLETKQGFEVRQYPAAKWVCNTNKNVIPSADPLNGWQQKFDNDPLKVMSSSDWKNQASSKMFMKLFKYISGANSQGQEVKMTTPVPTKHTTKGYDSEETQMCFWLGKKWQDQIAPRPLEKDAADTEVVETQPRKVYVRKFGGFAMSHDDWKSQYDQLVADLQLAGVKYKGPGEWYHLSYDSPWTMKNRRNEVWVEVEQ